MAISALIRDACVKNNEMWQIDDSLADEVEFQAEVIRDLIKSAGIDPHFYEMFAFKSLALLSAIVTKRKPVDALDIIVAETLLNDLDEVFDEFNTIVNEEENIKG